MSIPPISASISKMGGKLTNTVLKNEKTFNGFQKIARNAEFTGMNYSFLGMASIMLLLVLVPRLKTVFTRKTDDNKAKMDEFKEICFRDLQTIGIMLLLLNGISAILANKTGKTTGLPLTNKPFNKVFDTNKKGLKGLGEKAIEIIHNPLQKGKTILSNIGKAFNPLGGVFALNNDEITSRYSNFANIEDVTKMLNGIEQNQGNKEKIFSKIISSTLKEATSKGKSAEIIQGLQDLASKNSSALTELTAEKVASDPIKSKLADAILEYLKSPDNYLAMKGRKNSAVFRTSALAMEAGYLGFGLPALYKNILKRKYLNDTPEGKPREIAPKVNISSLLINRQVSFTENKLFQKFVK